MGVILVIVGKLFASKLGIAGVSAIGALAIAKVAPLVRPLFGKVIKAQVDKVLAPNLADPIEKVKLLDLAIAAMAYAEYKIPDRGAGAARKALVVDKLNDYLPELAAQAIADLVEEAFESLDDELKERTGINKPK